MAMAGCQWPPSRCGDPGRAVASSAQIGRDCEYHKIPRLERACYAWRGGGQEAEGAGLEAESDTSRIVYLVRLISIWYCITNGSCFP